MSKFLPDRVLVAGPVGDDSFAENIIHTLRQMGIQAIYDAKLTPAKYMSPWRKVLRELRTRTSKAFVDWHEAWLIQAAKAYRPSLFLAPTQVISDNTLYALRKCGVRARVAWWGDPPGYLSRMGLLSDQWDLIFLKDSDAVAKFQRVRLRAFLLHEAMNPSWHRTMTTCSNQEVVVAGSFYGYRQALVLRLINEKIKLGLYGGPLPRWAHPEIRKLHTGRYLVKEEKSRVFGQGLACLNSTQIIEGNSLNCRAFEIAGAGGLHLMEYRPIICECFDPGKEVLTFETFDELLEHLERFQSHPRESIKIREAAARRALAEHTYQHRLETIFEHVAQL